MSTLLLILRACLSTVLFVAGAAKLVDRAGSRQAFAGFGLPDTLATPLSHLLPWVELALAVALLPAGVQWGAAGTLILFGLFTIGVGIAVARGQRGACHCFGSLHSAPISGRTLARNLALTGLAALLVWQWEANADASLLAWLRDPFRGDRTTVTAEVLAIGMLGVIGVSLARLIRQGRELSPRAGEPAQPSDQIEEFGEGKTPGSPAPDFTLRDLKGEPVGLNDMLEAGAPVLLTFISPSCASCEALLSDIERWDHEHSEILKVVVISSEGPEENVAKFANRKIGLVLQNGLGVGGAYEVQGVPCAVLINSDGTIGSFLANRNEAIKRLVEQTVSQSVH